ncbi:methyltransferase domain-containing protein [Spirochaeta isovalerica]|uniref:Arsenite methyltransferase n=1 Tax=Spirochaeta isovalerica TaxID=150 RepID=A0A841R4K2_9SPIO|nr:methyltransferase domain-containing protein [Spirochaeta isovalerica]MBB6478723.1 ubiquinone/menaquinone biosynthesis C-methylase UbiE [Spirochaeta isovalerica]
MSETNKEINIRYSVLAQDDSCCLSCGGALDKSEAGPGDVCVDLGSGRGTDVLRLAEIVGDEGFVYGLDLSDGMISKAKKTAERMGVQNVEFIQTDLSEIPLEEKSVDIIISNCVLNHVSDKQKIWNEIYRILKKGGTFTVSDIYSSEPVPAEYANDPAAIAECWAGSVTRDVYLETLANAGFDNIEILEESAPYEKGKILCSSWTIRGTRTRCCG